MRRYGLCQNLILTFMVVMRMCCMQVVTRSILFSWKRMTHERRTRRMRRWYAPGTKPNTRGSVNPTRNIVLHENYLAVPPIANGHHSGVTPLYVTCHRNSTKILEQVIGVILLQNSPPGLYKIYKMTIHIYIYIKHISIYEIMCRYF